MTVAAYVLRGNGLAESVVPLLAAGARAAGEQVDNFSDRSFVPEHAKLYDAAIFWGYVETCQAIMNAYRDAGKAAIYLDLAYWQRGNYYKVAVNSRHSTKYFQKRPHNGARRKFVPPLMPYRAREYILVAGMGNKAAWAEKLEPLGSWENAAIAEIKKHTDRPILLRPKPGHAFKTLDVMCSWAEPLGVALAKAHVVVTHHSNVAIDGLIDGAGVFAWDGVASVMGLQDLSKIEDPIYPDNRDQWLNDVSYCQWSVDELRNGTCWKFLKEEGLVK